LPLESADFEWKLYRQEVKHKFHQLHRPEDAFIVFLIFLRSIQWRLENFTGVKCPAGSFLDMK
jgi:hypothetical protein